MSTIYRFLFFMLLLSGGATIAQQYPLVKYTVREGLVQNQVLSLLKDSRGYVWCGTWYGLSRFNGETFENYTEAEGLWNAGVMDISEDKEGNIWVSSGSRLARFDGKTFKKLTVPTDSPYETGFSGKTNPVQIIDRTKGVLLEVKDDTLLPVSLPNFPAGRKEDLLYHLSSETYYWIADQQVVSYHDGQLKTVTEESNWQQSIYTIHDKIHLIRKSEDGTIEDYTVEAGRLNPYLKRSETEFEVLRPLNYPFLFEHGNSLYYLPPGSLKAERISEKPPGYFHFESQNQKVTSMLWIPTEKGLWGLTLTGFKNFGEDEVPYAWHVVEDQNGDFLFSSHGKGIQKYDGKKLTAIPKVKYHRAAIKAYQALGLTPGADGWYYRALRD